MSDINLGLLEHGPHANLIHTMASKCYADSDIQAMWVGGSLASGTGDIYSDIDFRIAVEPGELDRWANPNWADYLPIESAGGVMMRFGEHALLHHLVLSDGTIVDFYVQDTTKHNPEPKVVVLACRNEAFGKMLESFAQPAAMLVREIDGAVARQFFVDYWITTHKEMKALARKYDHASFVGLFYERMALLRAWHMQIAGKDINARATVHMLGKLHQGLGDAITEQQHNILGLPSQTPEQTVLAIDAIRAEMARVGRWLAEKYQFDYVYELEAVVQHAWNEKKDVLVMR